MKINEYTLRAATVNLDKNISNFWVSKNVFETEQRNWYKIRFEYQGLEIYFDLMTYKEKSTSAQYIKEEIDKNANNLDYLISQPIDQKHISFISSMITHKHSDTISSIINIKGSKILETIESYVEKNSEGYDFKELYKKSLNEVIDKMTKESAI